MGVRQGLVDVLPAHVLGEKGDFRDKGVCNE